MSDRIIIRDVLPERIQLHEPAFYNGLSTYQLYVQETTEETPLSLTEWLKLVYGVTPEFNKSATHVQWRVEGSETWIDLFPLSDIKGDKGDGAQLQVSATHIQWKNTTDVNWVDLIALSTIKGDKGDDGYTPIKGVDYNDGENGHTPYIGENGNWWINGEDTGENAIAPTMSVIEQYVQGYAEPKKGADDYFVSNAQVILINDIINKVDKITGHSLVADTEIVKIHSRNTDSTLLSENGLHSVYIDANGTFHVKDISQVGSTYETHAEQLFTTKNEIILRDGAIAGLGVGEYVGLRAKLYDGVNDGNLVFDKDGWARVGDVGALQKLATIEETPTNGYLMKYNTSTFRLESYDPLLLPVSTAASRAFVNQNGGTIYHITRWFTPTSALTIAANGLSATITSGQFTADMTGAKLKLTGGTNEPIITYVSTNSITLSFAVDASFFGQSVAVADWGVYNIDNGNSSGTRFFRYYNRSSGLTLTNDGGISANNIQTSGSGFYTAEAVFRNDYKFRISSTSSQFGTTDIGWFRPSAGLLQIYDGITTTALRDLKLRSLFADKIIPNSDTTGVVIRNAADGADVAYFDTANKRVGLGTLFPIKKVSIEVPTNANTTDEAYSFQANFAGRYYTIAKISAREQNQYNGDLILYTQPVQSPLAGLIDNTVERMRILANGNIGVGISAAESKLDVNGTTTLRDWVYLNNGTHTGDAVGDYRSKTINNVKVIEVCTGAHATRGSGTWKRASGTSDLGGYMISLTNKTGAASVKGSVVSLSAATASAFVLQSNEFDAVGIVYEAGVSDGSECWVVVSGIAELLLEDNTASTMGNWVISSAADGRANATQPTPTPNSTINEHTTHFKEIGHCMEAKTAGTNVLAKCVIHFN